MECRFCKINQEKTKIIYEGKHCKVIFSNPRLMPGHILIIPNKHVEKISELDEKERNEIFDLTIEYQEKILKNIASGCDIKQNCRPFQKESELKVDHLHIHLQPRELYDELYQECQKHETDLFQPLTNEEFNKIKDKLNKD